MKRYLSSYGIEQSLSNLSLLTFEVTDACNLKCKYCGYGEFYNDYDRRTNKMMPIEYAKNIIDYLLPYWNSNLNTSSDRNIYVGFYGGEPLLNMSFIQSVIDYLSHLSIQNRHFTYSMTTNAMLLDKYMDYLAENKFSLLISLDGNKYNDSYRVDKMGKDSFERVINNVNLLQDRHPDYFQKHVNFNAVLHNRNSVQEIHNFFKQEYNKIPSIGELNDMGIRPDKVKEFQNAYRNQIESLYQAEHYEEIDKERFIASPTYQSVCTFLHQYCDFVYRDYNELLYGKQETDNWITGTCLPFGKKMFVTVNGKILPCERIGQQYDLGSVDFNEVHLDFESIANKYNAYFAKMEKQCTSCFGKKSCIQCIFNITDLEGSPVCKGKMGKKDFERYKAQHLEFIAQYPEDYYRLMEDVVIE